MAKKSIRANTNNERKLKVCFNNMRIIIFIHIEDLTIQYMIL